MACGCGKNKKKDKGKNMKNKKSKEKHNLIYITNPNCGWCKKADPVVEALIKKGYEITTLDVSKPEESERANELKSKYNAQCGTPHFIDAETGNQVCGFREDVLEDWAKGKDIPAPPPRPQQPQPGQPNAQQGPQIENVKIEYVWLDGNSPSNIRSKVKYQKMNISAIQEQTIMRMIPQAYFDGSSTNQTETNNSDCILRPIKVIPSPFDPPANTGQTISWIALCEVYDDNDNPHPTNSRRILQQSVIQTQETVKQMIVGFEQEYVMFDSKTKLPIGWLEYENSTPPPQGNYYCGVGIDNTKGRKLADTHAMLCNKVGIGVQGTNAEVMLGQWEYQTIPKQILMAADEVIISRFILQRLAEDMNVSISYDPKPMEGDWNGSGGHINFSTDYMRREADLPYLTLLCASMEKYHEESMKYYGVDNDKRLTGKHETSSMESFSWGESDRTASIRIPLSTVKNNGRGHLEDRRPAANIDPYQAFNHLLNSISKINEEILQPV